MTKKQPSNVRQRIFDGSNVLDTPTVVPRENKILARLAVAARATDAADCRTMLEALGLYDLDTLPEVPYE